MLLENVTLGSSDELSLDIPVVCVAVIKWTDDSDQRDINYHCCGMHKETSIPSILCDLTVDQKWLKGFDGITTVLTIFMSLFILALPLALPDGVFSLQRERDKENSLEQRMLWCTASTVDPHQQDNTGMADQQNMQTVNSEQDESDHRSNRWQQREEESEMIPVDDASPMTFSTLLLKCARTMPDVGLSFNIKLFLVNLCVVPCVIYLRLGLYDALETTYINESIRKRVSLSNIFTMGPFFVILDKVEITWLIEMVFSTLIIAIFLRPEHFMVIYCPICSSYRIDDDRDYSLSDEMRLHFKELYKNLGDLILLFANLITCVIFLPPCRNYRQPSLTMHVIYALLRLIYIPFTLLLRVVFGAICFPLFLFFLLSSIMWFSPLFLFYVWFTREIHKYLSQYLNGDEDEDEDEDNYKNRCKFLCASVISGPYILSLIFSNYESCHFFNRVLGYTIAGLVLNEDVITPYVAFFLVVTTNIYLCYANMQEKYKEVKEMILKCQNEFRETNSNDPEGTIRTQLFWFVCDRVLPIKSEICRMFRDMILILVFLFLVVYSVVVFGNQYKASAIFATIYVFVGGLIPALVLKGLTKRNKFIGWVKIRIEREIETAVNEYRNSRPDNDRVATA